MRSKSIQTVTELNKNRLRDIFRCECWQDSAKHDRLKILPFYCDFFHKLQWT